MTEHMYHPAYLTYSHSGLYQTLPEPSIKVLVTSIDIDRPFLQCYSRKEKTVSVPESLHRLPIKTCPRPSLQHRVPSPRRCPSWSRHSLASPPSARGRHTRPGQISPPIPHSVPSISHRGSQGEKWWVTHRSKWCDRAVLLFVPTPISQHPDTILSLRITIGRNRDQLETIDGTTDELPCRVMESLGIRASSRPRPGGPATVAMSACREGCPLSR